MQSSWLALLPPLIVVIGVLITSNLNLSLFIGILVGAAIATQFSPLASLSLIYTRGSTVLSDIDTIYLYLFLFVLGAIIVLIGKTGGAYAFARHLQQRNPSKRQVERYSILLSFLLSIDDYLSALTVGYVMRPLTDRLKIPRAKLAFLVHSMASSLILLLPISSWVTILTGTLEQSGINASATKATKIIAEPFFIYIQTIPYLFYALLTLFCVLIIIQTQTSFGPMKTHEKKADETGNLFGGKNPLTKSLTTEQKNSSINDLIIPLATLLISVVIGMLWTGNTTLFGGTKSALDAFKSNPNLNLILLSSGCISLGMSYLFARFKKQISWKNIPSLFSGSYELMGSALLLITLAAILGKILQIDLQAGTYLAHLLLDHLPLYLLPLLTFIIALLLAGITGSAFGAMMLLIPITIPMLLVLNSITPPALASSLPLLLPTLGAILSGAVCGNHISPISDTTIMASTSTNISPLEHTKTQLPYALPALIGTSVAFLVIGLLNDYSSSARLTISLGAGALTSIITLGLFVWLTNKKEN